MLSLSALLPKVSEEARDCVPMLPPRMLVPITARVLLQCGLFIYVPASFNGA